MKLRGVLSGWYVLVLWVVALLVSLSFWLLRNNESGLSEVSLACSLIFDFALFIVPLYYIYLTGRRCRYAKVFLLIAAYALSDFIASFLWFLSETAVMSIADVFYILGYLSLLGASVCGIHATDSGFFRDWKRVALLFGIYAIVLCAFIFLMPGSYSPDVSFIENFVISGYASLDLVIIINIFVVIYYSLSGRLSRGWYYAILGSLLFLIGDAAYIFEYAHFSLGSLIDLGWLIGSLLFIYSALIFGNAFSTAARLIDKD